MFKISQYKTRIIELNPLVHSEYTYNAAKWSRLDANTLEAVKDFEDNPISRQDVIDAYAAYYQGFGGVLRPFILTMIWGFENTGYGPYRTEKLLSAENDKLINSALDALKNEDLKLAYKVLMSVKGLGISYASKILYFATRALDWKKYALIFDMRVARNMVKLALGTEVSGILDVYPSGKFKDYSQYIQLLHSWATQMEVPAENIELFLFDGKF
jgi:hypothetical protein